jgi:hypothetical protein
MVLAAADVRLSPLVSALTIPRAAGVGSIVAALDDLAD